MDKTKEQFIKDEITAINEAIRSLQRLNATIERSISLIGDFKHEINDLEEIPIVLDDDLETR